jgi:hypothetical protein
MADLGNDQEISNAARTLNKAAEDGDVLVESDKNAYDFLDPR